MKIAEIMTKDVSTCAVGDSLTRAAHLMWEARCGCVPVLDEGGDVVGVLTDRDICMAAYTQGRRLDDITVSTAMSRPARTCVPATTIEDAEDAMMAHAVRRLVVLDEAGQVRGIISIDDIARYGAEWDGGGDIDPERVALTLGEITRRTTTGDDEAPQADADEAETVRSHLAALETLRDEIRVDLNLAGKEARDKWRRLETTLRAAETRALKAQREGARSLAKLVESAKEFRSRIVKKRHTKRQAQRTAKRRTGSAPPKAARSAPPKVARSVLGGRRAATEKPAARQRSR